MMNHGRILCESINKTEFDELLAIFIKFNQNYKNIDFIFYTECNGYENDILRNLLIWIKQLNISNVKIIVTLQLLMVVLGRFSFEISKLFVYSQEKFILSKFTLKYLKGIERIEIVRNDVGKLSYDKINEINKTYVERNLLQKNMKNEEENKDELKDLAVKQSYGGDTNLVTCASSLVTTLQDKNVINLMDFKIPKDLEFKISISEDEALPLIQKLRKQFQNIKDMDAFKVYKATQNLYLQHAKGMKNKGSPKTSDLIKEETLDLIKILRRDGWIKKSIIIDYWISNNITDPDEMEESSKAVFSQEKTKEDYEEEKNGSKNTEWANSDKSDNKQMKPKKFKLDKTFPLHGKPDDYATISVSVLKNYLSLNMGVNKGVNIWSTTWIKLSNWLMNYIKNIKNARNTTANSANIIKKDEKLKLLIIRLLERLNLVEIFDDLQVDQDIDRIKNYKEIFDKDLEKVKDEFKRIICELSSGDAKS